MARKMAYTHLTILTDSQESDSKSYHDSVVFPVQWMAMEEYAAQPFVKKNPLFDSIANICLAKKDMKYTGFSPFSATSSSGKTNILYFNNQDLKQPLSSGNQA